MIELTSEQRRAVADREPAPPRAFDPDTQITYVLVPEQTYDRVKSLLGDDPDDSFPRDLYPHVLEVFGRDGWDDPAMDAYDALDPRKSS